MKKLPLIKPSAFAYAMQPVWRPYNNVLDIAEFVDLNVKLPTLLATAKSVAVVSTAAIQKMMEVDPK